MMADSKKNKNYEKNKREKIKKIKDNKKSEK